MLCSPPTSKTRSFVTNGLKTVPVLCLLLFVNTAFSQGSVGIDIDHLSRQGVDQRLQSDGVGLLGDAVDPNTGSVVFRHTDVSIPGNFGLEVAIHRRRSSGSIYPAQTGGSFADWEIELPRISVIVAQEREQGQLDPPDWKDNRCTSVNLLGPSVVFSDPYWVPNIFDPMADFPDLYIVEDYEYSNGVVLEIPGRGSQQLLDIGSSSQWPAGTKKVTTDNWAISCLTAAQAPNAQGEGFVATAPNGDKYTFDKLIYKTATPIDVALTMLERSTAAMVATKVTDVHGNTVNYNYVGSQLDTITSSDGRIIKLIYSNGRVSQVKANYLTVDERVWNYSYAIAPNTQTLLDSVTLPDQRTWSFDLRAMDIPADPTWDCTKPPHTVSVTHPNGVTGSFTFSETQHRKGDSTVATPRTRSCQGSPPVSKPYFDAMSLTQKTLSGPGYPAATWTYSYWYVSGTNENGTSVPDTKGSTVIDPLGRTTTRTYFVNGNFEGLLQKEKTSVAGSAGETIDHTYLIESMVGSTYVKNANPNVMNKPRRETNTVVARGSTTFTTARIFNTSQSSSLYSHGFPTQVQRSTSTTTQTRIVDTVYAHNRTKWVLGLSSTVTRNGKLFDTYLYDSYGRRDQHYAFGNLFQKIGYHTAAGRKGTIAWVEDALPVPRRVSFNNYKRGLPRQVVRADGSKFDREIDDNGWVTQGSNWYFQVTDPNYAQTRYDYTAVGWLKLIDRDAPWTDTTISYSPLGGAFTQTSTRGPTRITTFYDSLTRPYLVKTQPLSGGGKTSYVQTDYDALGQVTTTSFPSILSSPTDGISTSYDELGRPTVTAENVTPFATTTYAYLSSNRTVVTDPLGNVTTTYHHAFGTPDNKFLRRIDQPLNVKTYFYRNDYGQVYRLRQMAPSVDESQYSYYDSSQRLCRHWTAEGGYTAYGYNAANEMTSYTKGASGGSSCSAPSGSSKVSLTYDDLGRIETTDFDDSSTPDITRTYDPNGNLLTINRVASNAIDNVDWTYTYDNAGNFKTEQLQIDGQTYGLSYLYDNNGNRTQRTLPSGQVVTYPVNGLGQTSSISSGGTNYASNLVYHVGGKLESANYGNGHALMKTWTPRQQPLNVSTQLGGTKAIDKTYGYDALGQVKSVTDTADTANGGNNRTYGYDALNRLSSATGPWGAGVFNYNLYGDLLSKTLGSRTVTVSYDAATNRATQSVDVQTGQPTITRAIGYDGRGNVTTLGGMIFTYDMTDQPVSQSGTVPATYVYDGNLKRTKQIMGGKTIYSIYDASGTMVHRYNETDSKVTEYVAAAGVGVRIENSTTSYTFKDHLGSPVTGTNSTGAISWRERYLPYGEKMLDPTENKDQTGFTDHIQDDATGLTYMQARYYDPVVGRFLSIDPVGFVESNSMSFNRYAYANNNPYSMVDSDGQRPVGINFGGAFTWRGEGRGGSRGSLSTYILFDTETFELAIASSQEVGLGLSGKGVAPTGFFNLVGTSDGTTLDVFEGVGISLSGAKIPKYLGISFARSMPGPLQDEFNKLDSAEGLRLSDLSVRDERITELGLAVGLKGSDIGVSITTGRVLRTDIIGRSIDGARNKWERFKRRWKD